MVIGLTGGIASGKSTVARMMKDLAIPVIDADAFARIVVRPGEPAYHKIVARFGNEVLRNNGEIDRSKLGAIVFANKKERQALNEIVHPEIRKKMQEEKERLLALGKDVVLDIPLLFENGLEKTVDRTLVVYVDESEQLKRLMERDGLSQSEARARIQAQLPLEEKKKRADAVIDNRGTRARTRQQLMSILQKWGVKISS